MRRACTDFPPELLTEKIEKEMGIPLSDIKQFNVKGEVLIYKNGEVATIWLRLWSNIKGLSVHIAEIFGRVS